MTSDLRPLIDKIYSPNSLIGSKFCFDDWPNHAHMRYFSAGRHAFLAALRIAGIKRDDRVLIPDFICREMLAPLYCLGASPSFYAVERDGLTPHFNSDTPVCKAVVAINYFGFAQDLSPFHEYCNRTQALLIEDNAHGLFSRDSSGDLLGTRGDMGILSMRKTLPIPDGAALLVNNPQLFDIAPAQLPPSDTPESFRFVTKRILRRLVKVVGSGPIYGAINFFQCLQAARTGSAFPVSAIESERDIPVEEKPGRHLGKYLSIVDPSGEVNRRRDLYSALDERLREWGATPVMKSLPSGTSPYCYAFFIEASQKHRLMTRLHTFRLKCHLWPQLPSKLESTAPSWQRSVWTVAFLW